MSEQYILSSDSGVDVTGIYYQNYLNVGTSGTKQSHCQTCKGSGKVLLPSKGYKKKERHQRDAFGPCKMCRL